MSMLADRKRRQKWSLNPRGNEWSKNTNKFGQKLMERMGWREGKGLGANEDGLTEHVRVAFKNDSKGIGFKESVEWSHQQDNFSALLEELNDSNSNPIEDTLKTVKSLEEKSEKSRARLHYKKFTRGKDLSRYSEKDLANILGRRKLKQSNELVNEEVESNDIPSHPERFGVNTTMGGSMVDYFKQKLPNFITPSKNDTIEDDSETEVNYGFGFVTSKIKRKKRKSNDLNDLEEIPPVKKHKIKTNDITNEGLVNSAFDPVSRNIITNGRHVLETIAENDEQSSEPKDCIINQNNSDQSDLSNEEPVVKQPKKKKIIKDESIENDTYRAVKSKKKKKKCKDKSSFKDIARIEDIKTDEKNVIVGFDNPCFDMNNLAMLNDSSTIPFETRHKKVKTVQTDGESVDIKLKVKENKRVSNIDDSNYYIETDATLICTKKNFKNAGKSNEPGLDNKNQSGCFDNPSFTDIDITVGTSLSNNYNPFEVKPKKKSKRHCKGVENPTFYVSNDDTDISRSTASAIGDSFVMHDDKSEVKVKQIQKNGLNNPDFVINLNENESAQTKLKRKKSKRSFEEDPNVDNIGSLESVDENKTKCKRQSKSDCDGPCFQIKNNIDNSEVKAKKRMKNQANDTSFDNNEISEEHGVDNLAMNLSDSFNIDDCDLILNVTDEPVRIKTPETKKSNKNVRFSKVNMEYIYEDVGVSADDIAQRQELCDINNKVIEASTARHKLRGLDNAAFNLQTNVIEESVNSLAKSLENCQAEVENGINESKIKKTTYQERMIGELNNPDGEDEPHPDGLILRYKNAKFSRSLPHWERRNDQSSTYPKRSYKHLIKGDIILGFKNTNLHKVSGYGKTAANIRRS